MVEQRAETFIGFEEATEERVVKLPPVVRAYVRTLRMIQNPLIPQDYRERLLKSKESLFEYIQTDQSDKSALDAFTTWQSEKVKKDARIH